MSRYVFPDGELAPLETVIAAAERAGFEVHDVESLRNSYASTLGQCVANLEHARTEAVALSSEATYRIWRTYMAGAAVAFRRARKHGGVWAGERCGPKTIADRFDSLRAALVRVREISGREPRKVICCST